jgi:hypothetical protein
VFAENIGAWNGAAWSALGASSPGPIWTTAIAFAPNGDLIAAGLFRTLGLVNAYRVARRSGSTWSVLGGDFDTVVRDLAVLPSGDVVACGQFTSIGGVPMARVARWNGTSWAGLGTGMNDHVYALEVLPNGDLVAGGWFGTAGGVAANRVARWNGSAWAPMGAGIAGPYVHALAVLPGGDVVAGGQLAVGNLDFHVARWDGVAWTQLGTLSGNVKALVAMANGDVVAGGTFTGSGSVPLLRVARWNGSAWSALGSGIGEWSSGDSVDALAALPDGDVVAAGYFDTIGAVPAAGIARWSGTAWSPLATFASGLSSTGVIETLATPPGGGLVAGGLLTRLDDAVAVGVVELGTTCPASAITSGAGCSGSGGPNVLTATSLPWVGGTFASIATGMPANGLALDVLGLATTSVPLVTILPQGMPGCTLRVAPDLVRVVMPAGGAAATTLPIPSSAALVGTVLHQQVGAIEADAAGAFVAVTSTNALTLTIGRF